MKSPSSRIFVLRGFLSLCAAVLLGGCFETQQEFTLNPDGSGKVVHQSSFQKLDLSDKSDSPEESLKAAVAEIIQRSKGVEAWRDVSFKQLPDSRIFFKGTAYFKDLSALEIPNQTMLEFDWQKTAADSLVLTARTKAKNADQTKAGNKAGELATLTPQARALKIKEERGKFQQMKPMMTAFMETLRHAVVFHLPGKTTASSNFQKDAAGNLSMTLEGKKLLAAMDKLANDDAWISKNLGSLGGSEKPPLDEDINAALFGVKGPVQATVTGAAKPLFDYAAEKAAALKQFAAMQDQLGLGAISLAPPATGQPLKSIKVVGARLVTGADKKREIRPLNEESGYTLALLGELPGSVLAVTDQSAFEKAIADDGTNLLSDSEFERAIHFPRLSADKSGVLFEIKLKLPGPTVKGLKELSGHLQYSVAGKTREVDLGFDTLAAAAKGKQLGAQIEKIGKAWNDADGQQLSLKLNGPSESLKSVSLVVNGEKTVLTQSGYSGGGNSFTYTFTSKTGFPADAHLVAEIFDEIKLFNVPFKLENLSLLGGQL